MERRDDDLDAVVLDDPHAVEQVLLGREAAGGRARRRAAELVDELVDPAGGERGAGAAREELPPGQAHQEGLDEHERAEHPVQVPDDPRQRVAAARCAR